MSQVPISLETLGFRAARYGGSDPDCTKACLAQGQVGTEAESSLILSSKVPRGGAFFKLHKNALLVRSGPDREPQRVQSCCLKASTSSWKDA